MPPERYRLSWMRSGRQPPGRPCRRRRPYRVGRVGPRRGGWVNGDVVKAQRTPAPASEAERLDHLAFDSWVRVLGDYGAAVGFAGKVDPRTIADAERRARYWEDTALALHGGGRDGAAFEAPLAAEHDVPEEVRYRPWAQQLTRDLLASPAGYGIRDFATLVGVA